MQAAGPGFEPLMTCYLTDETDPDEIARGFEDGVWVAAKLYPAGATTNSASGVTDIRNIYPALERMQRIGMVLCVHGEVTDPDVDVFDREAVFIDRILSPIVEGLPGAEDRARAYHHGGSRGFRPRQRPQRGRDRHAAASDHQPQRDLRRRAPAARLLPARRQARAAPARHPQGRDLGLRRTFFLGTDSAPHARHAKESGCGCAGIFNAPFALESYASVFEEEGALDRFEAFASENGARFYGLPLNEGTVTLERADTQSRDESKRRVSSWCPSTPARHWLEIGRLIRRRRVPLGPITAA